MAEQVEQVEQVQSSSRRTAMLQRLRAARARTAAPQRRAADAGPPPLSPAQRRLWFLDRLAPGSAAYNIPAAYRLRGPLKVPELRKAVRDVVLRHAVLRTRFAELDGEPVQVVEPGAFEVGFTDLSGLDDPENAARAAAAEQVRLPFELSRGPLLRASLLRLSHEDHVLLLTVHHAVFDGWSLVVFADELAACYRSRAEGVEPELPELEFQFGDYAAWLAAPAQEAAASAAAAHWLALLEGATTVVELPSDRTRPPVASGIAGEVVFTVPAEVATGLRAAAAQHGATLFMAALAAFGVLVGKQAELEDLLIATPAYNRPLAELREMIGFFASTLPFRIDLSGDLTFAELLVRIRETALDAFAHQDVPLDRVVGELAVQRDHSRNPLVQILFSLLSTGSGVERGGFTLAGVKAEEFPSGAVGTRFDVEAHLFETDGAHLLGRLLYAAELFDADAMRRFAEQYQAILASAAADPGCRISALVALPDEERALIAQWNRGPAAPEPEAGRARPLTVAEHVEHQATRTPDAEAVRDGERGLSYAELNAAANRLARHLEACGVGPESVVGLCMERGADAAVAVLAIIKAGAAYVPLDPADPADRLRFLYADSGARIVVADAVGRGCAPAPAEHVVCPEELHERLLGYPSTDAPARAGLDSLLYLVYTSGSTGRPKAVAMDQRSKLNMMRWAADAYGSAPRVLQYYSINPDTYLLELMLAWWTGGTLVVVPRDARRDMPALAEVIREARVTTAILPTAVLEHLARETERPDDLGSLRRVATTGDRQRITPAVRELFRAIPGAGLDNHYGQTEANVVTLNRLTGDAQDWPESGPMGRPIDGMRIYVLDSGLRPVPIGTPGDAYAAGPQLARGYAGRPEATAAAFLPDPFADRPGARMYRTGDRARWRADGVLEFLGRADVQLKIRGYRIEPGEVEARLAELPGVGDAAVVGERPDAGDPRLVAFVQPRPGTAPTAESLRSGLRELLPDYLVPSAIHVVDRFPRTASGKPDRAALLAATPVPAAPTAPRTETEAAVAAVWSELLGVQTVGAEDSFFALGGHSLLVTRLVYRLRECLGVELPLRAVFSSPTVAGLAAEVEALRCAGTAVAEGPGRLGPGAEAARDPEKQGTDSYRALVHLGKPDRLPLSRAQRRLWLTAQIDGPRASYNLPVVLGLTGPLDRDALELALLDLFDRHRTLRTVVDGSQGDPVQVLVDPRSCGPVLPVVEVGEQGTQAALATAVGYCFDLGTALPMRPTLLRVSPDRHILLLLIHHIAVDGWSMGPLLRDLATAYAARRAGASPQWAPLPVDYGDYTLWQQASLGTESEPSAALAAQVEYWKARLAGLPEELELPGARPRPAALSGRGAHCPLEIDAALHRKVRALARHTGCTVFMVLQAALAALLTRLGCGTDLAIGAPTTGRTDKALDELVGLFVNTLVLRTDTSGDPAFLELLARVRAGDLDDFANQDVPFEQLVELLNPARSLARHPLFQVMLSMEDGGRAGAALDGLEVRYETVQLGIAKFDLTVALVEHFDADGEPAGMPGALEYAAELFDAPTAAGFARRLVRLLGELVAAPELPLSSAALLEPEEERRILRDWNDTGRPLPAATVPELLAAAVARDPRAPALVLGDERLSFSALHARANRIAHELIGRGAGPGGTVVLAVPRSTDTIAALFGTLASGAAYAPLDPRHPAERLEALARDIRPAAVLATTETAARLAQVPALADRIIVLDDPAVAARLAAHPASAPTDEQRSAPLTPGHAAYLISTSGSTGRPKAVVVPHRGVANLYQVHRQTVIEPAVRAAGGRRMRAAFTDEISFDASWGTLVWLLAGHEVHLIPDELRHDPVRLVAHAAERRLDLFNTTPSYIKQLLWAGLGSGTYRPAVITLGGEAVSEALWTQLAGLRSVCHNFYGPTEFTVDALRAPIEPDQHTNIGRPLPGSRAFVLDDGLRPVPEGVTGELCLAGPQLADGYRGLPAATAERFVPNPFGEPGSRLYRTGDLVRLTASGTAEFVGRADGQVKIRGFRVELGEIEAALLRHEAVARAAVAAPETAGERRLAAYVVPDGPARGPADPELAALLRTHLAGLLPEHMVPGAFVFVEDLPLTSNGKLDYRALPDPVPAPTPAGRAPQGEAEERLCEIFAEVLGIEAAGVDEDFFALGGHSLLAARMVARLRAEFDARLTIRDVFTAPTPALLAEALVATRPALGGLEPLFALRSGRPGTDRPALFCLHPAVGISWVYAGLLRHLDPEQPVYGLQARGLTEPERSARRPADLVEDYAALIRSVRPHGPYALLGWSFGGMVAHRLASRLQAEGEQVSLLALLDSYPPRAAVPSPVYEYDDPAAAADLAASIGHDPHSPDSPLAGLDEPGHAALNRVFVDLANMNDAFDFDIFHGSVLHVRATADKDGAQFPAESWRAFVDGPIEPLEVDCAHGELVGPRPMRLIGPAVAERLRAL
jgi:amino acid adenylation domain-containing protein